jgi:TP901 family phage tail tape measure protein
MGDLTKTMEKDMSDAAREVAKVTTFSAEQAAESFFFLASAGLDAEASIAALPRVAQFAQAGMFDMSRATDLLTDAQSALGLTIRDDAVKNMENMIKVSDVLVRANTLSNATVEQFSTSLTTKAGPALSDSWQGHGGRCRCSGSLRRPGYQG